MTKVLCAGSRPDPDAVLVNSVTRYDDGAGIAFFSALRWSLAIPFGRDTFRVRPTLLEALLGALELIQL